MSTVETALAMVILTAMGVKTGWHLRGRWIKSQERATAQYLREEQQSEWVCPLCDEHVPTVEQWGDVSVRSHPRYLAKTHRCKVLSPS